MDRIMKSEVEIFCDAPNNVILINAGRNFPGIVIQGDQLRSLLRLAERASAEFRSKASGEALDNIEELEELLREKVELYERVLSDNGFDLPYVDRLTSNPKAAAG